MLLKSFYRSSLNRIRWKFRLQGLLSRVSIQVQISIHPSPGLEPVLNDRPGPEHISLSIEKDLGIDYLGTSMILDGNQTDKDVLIAFQSSGLIRKD